MFGQLSLEVLLNKLTPTILFPFLLSSSYFWLHASDMNDIIEFRFSLNQAKAMFWVWFQLNFMMELSYSFEIVTIWIHPLKTKYVYCINMF